MSAVEQSLLSGMRRFSFSRKYKPSAKPDPLTLAAFLKTYKSKYLDDVRSHNSKARDWTVAMGNEAGDLDSVASAIAYSWIETEINKRPTIPLMQSQRRDFVLRPENVHALSLAGLNTSEFDELLSVDDFPWNAAVFPSTQFALVDHNRILPHFLRNNPDARVVAVIDHHADEELYKDTASPRVIQPAGSCSSLVTTVFSPPSLPAELATLLLCAILIDTNGLKQGGKALQVDREAAAYLLPRSTFAPSVAPKLLARISENHKHKDDDLRDTQAIKDLSEELSVKKFAVNHFGVFDLLRRDYKQYVYDLPWAHAKMSIRAGLSTVPLGLREWISRSDFWSSVKQWMSDRGLSVLGILTSFVDEPKIGKKSGKGKHKREMVWIINEGAEDLEELNDLSDVEDPWKMPKGLDTNVLANRLWKGIEACSELEVEDVGFEKYGLQKDGGVPPQMRAKVYKQRNVNATRKTTAPLLKKIMEDSDSPHISAVSS